MPRRRRKENRSAAERPGRVAAPPASSLKPPALTITLRLPPRELSPNARPHYLAKAEIVKAYRRGAYLKALVWQPRSPLALARVTARFWFKDRRRRDRDNLLASLKAAFDGLADAGVVADDSRMIHMPVECDVDRRRPRVEITVEREGRGHA